MRCAHAYAPSCGLQRPRHGAERHGDVCVTLRSADGCGVHVVRQISTPHEASTPQDSLRDAKPLEITYPQDTSADAKALAVADQEDTSCHSRIHANCDSAK